MFYLVFRFYREGAKANYRVTFESEEKIPNEISIKIAKKKWIMRCRFRTLTCGTVLTKRKEVFGLSVIESKGEMNVRG